MTQLPSTALFDRVRTIFDQAQERALRSVNQAMVQAYYAIGQAIVEDEQGARSGPIMARG